MSSPKFKVGDKVRVKCCEDLQQTVQITPEMLQYQKMEAEITEVFDDDGYNYHISISEDYWYWYEDMLDLIEAAPVEEERKPKFKAGDRVYIDGHETTHLNGKYGTITVVYSLVGYQVLVVEYGQNSYYYCEEDTLTLVPNPRFEVGDEENTEPIVSELETSCEHKALFRHYDGCFVTFCPRCGKILHIYYATKLYKGYVLIEGRIRELENLKGE